MDAMSNKVEDCVGVSSLKKKYFNDAIWSHYKINN